MTSRSSVPAGLSASSAKLYGELVTDLKTLGHGAASDLLLVEEVCRRLDRLADVRAVLAAEGVTVAGSKGQVRPHPLLGVETRIVHDVAAALDRLQSSPARRPWRYEVVGGRVQRREGVV